MNAKIAVLLLILIAKTAFAAEPYRRIPLSVLRDKIEGAGPAR